MVKHYDLDQTYFTYEKGEIVIMYNPYRTKMKRTTKEDKEFVLVDKGMHNGTIIDIKARDKPFKYIDIIVSCEGYKYKDGEPVVIKASYPDELSPSSYLGLFLSRMGLTIEAGKEIDFDLILGKPVEYMITHKKVKNDETGKEIIYNNLLRETLELKV